MKKEVSVSNVYEEFITRDRVFLRTPYNYDVDRASDESGLRCEDVSRTKQSFKEECDINTIVERFGIGYDIPAGGIPAEAFGDFSDSADFHTLVNRLAVAREAFDMFPAPVRARFDNDPEKLVGFLSDDANRDEAERLGLVFKRPKPDADVQADKPADQLST